MEQNNSQQTVSKKNGCLKIVLIGFISLLILGFLAKQCSGTTVENSSTDSSVDNNPVSKADSVKAKSLKGLFNEKKDEFEKSTWIIPKNKPPYQNQNGAYCYFSKEGNEVSNFRFVLQYAGDDWLFINNVKFNIDGSNFEYSPTDWNKDNETTVWEWSDQQVSKSDLELIRAIANGKSVKYRLEGSQYSSDKVLSAKYIQSIKNTLDYYEALGGQFY